ncbi:MAG: methyltransferase [Propionibacteriales bacterium]|nr:methyltransferase [Propionibacteriales bacterium]
MLDADVVGARLRRGIEYVDATLPYLAPSDVPPYRYTFDPPPGVPKEAGELDNRRTRIWSGWAEADGLSLDVQGFAIGHHPTPFADFRDEAAVEREYCPAMERLVLAHTGARRAVVFDKNVRHAPSAAQPDTFLGRPARLVHNDYTTWSAPQRVRDLLGPGPAEAVLKRRYAFINLWRPITGPLRDAPLALCDARSVAPETVVISTLIYPDRRGEVYRLTFSPKHRWVYFPDMNVEELIFIKCYDSSEDGRARFSAHTAFDDPTCPPDAPARQSVEVRTLVMW